MQDFIPVDFLSSVNSSSELNIHMKRVEKEFDTCS